MPPLIGHLPWPFNPLTPHLYPVTPSSLKFSTMLTFCVTLLVATLPPPLGWKFSMCLVLLAPEFSEPRTEPESLFCWINDLGNYWVWPIQIGTWPGLYVECRCPPASARTSCNIHLHQEITAVSCSRRRWRKAQLQFPCKSSEKGQENYTNAHRHRKRARPV